MPIIQIANMIKYSTNCQKSKPAEIYIQILLEPAKPVYKYKLEPVYKYKLEPNGYTYTKLRSKPKEIYPNISCYCDMYYDIIKCKKSESAYVVNCQVSNRKQ